MTAVHGFQYLASPLRLFAGEDSLEALEREFDRAKARRVALFCSGSLLRDARLHALVLAALGGRHAGTFSAVLPHSPRPAVEQAAEALRGMEADAVLAVGGGSVVVTARAASILAAEEDTLETLCTRVDADGRLVSPKLLAPKLAQLVVPTTPTTATVKAGSAVFDPATGERLALFDPKTRAQGIFIHPALLAPVPASVFVSAGLNTLSMAMEGLLSPKANAMADAQLMHAIRLIGAHLPEVARDGDAEGRVALVLAALLAGQGTDHAGGGMVSAIGHAVGARRHVDNGIVNAVVLPAALRYNAAAAPAGLGRIAAALGLATGDAVFAALERLLNELAVPRRLSALGVARAELDAIAEAAFRDWFLKGNARPIGSPAELSAFLAGCW